MQSNLIVAARSGRLIALNGLRQRHNQGTGRRPSDTLPQLDRLYVINLFATAHEKQSESKAA